MNLSTLQGDENLFLHRLQDICEAGQWAPRFSTFLTPRQLMIAQAFVQQRHYDGQVYFYGGFSDAVRQVLGAFPPHQPPDTALFPIRGITVRYRTEDALTHRDFLGAMMNLLIKRESIGDIVPGDGQCALFVLESVEQVILQELKKVGSAGVRCEQGTPAFTVRQEFDPIHGTVSSTRIDCLVSLTTGFSREKSAKLIQAERVQLQHVTVSVVSKEFCIGDTVSIRGWGKFIVDKIGSPTRKGRLPVDLRKYR